MKAQRYVGNRYTGEQVEVHILENGLAYSRVVKADWETSWAQLDVASIVSYTTMCLVALGTVCFLTNELVEV